MDVGNYYDMFLGPNAQPAKGVDDNGNPTSALWASGAGKYSNSAQANDADGWTAYDYVNPHPTSNDLGGLGEFWKAVGRPVAMGAAMYGGITGLNGLLGAGEAAAGGAGDVAAMGVDQVAAANPIGYAELAPVTDSISVTSIGSTPAGIGSSGAAVGTAAPMTLAEQYGAYGAGGGGVTGGLTTGTVGGFTGAAGGDFLVNGMPSVTPSGGIAEWMKANPGLTRLGGAALGAIADGKDTTKLATESKDPWAPAQPYLLDNLKQNAAMQQHYAANPFSTEQKTAYQGLLNTLANNQANVGGLLSNSNSFMQSRRGQMPAMQGLLSGTQAPEIGWDQYSNVGKK
jgi:hypothetical protein